MRKLIGFLLPFLLPGIGIAAIFYLFYPSNMAWALTIVIVCFIIVRKIIGPLHTRKGGKISEYCGGGYNFICDAKYRALIDLGRKRSGYEGGGYTFVCDAKYRALIDLMREK